MTSRPRAFLKYFLSAAFMLLQFQHPMFWRHSISTIGESNHRTSLAQQTSVRFRKCWNRNS